MCIERYCVNVERKLKGGLSAILVLSAIDGSRRPIHGYAIIRRISDRTGGLVTVGPGTVYPILRDLEEMGLVRHSREGSERGPDRKVYLLTADGREALGRFDDLTGRFLRAMTDVRGDADAILEPSPDP